MHERCSPNPNLKPSYKYHNGTERALKLMPTADPPGYKKALFMEMACFDCVMFYVLIFHNAEEMLALMENSREIKTIAIRKPNNKHSLI